MIKIDVENSVRIDTDRLILRRMQESDVPDFVEYDSHPDLAELRARKPFDADQARELISIQQNVALGEEDKWLRLVAEVKSECKVVGDTCIKVISAAHRLGEIGWELLSEVVDREAGKSRRRRQKGRERILRVTTNTPTPR